MALSNKEKRAIIVAIAFMHNFGKYYVPMAKNGTQEENEKAWEEAKIIYKDLYKRFKNSMTDSTDKKK